MPASKFFKGLTLGRANTSLLLAIAFALVGLAFFASQLWAEPKPADLSESPFALTANMLAQWQDGDVIVFVRHLERCSRVDAACLVGRQVLLSVLLRQGWRCVSSLQNWGWQHQIFIAAR